MKRYAAIFLAAILLAAGIVSLSAWHTTTIPAWESLGHSPTRVYHGHRYIFPVYPWSFRCKTNIAIACAAGQTPCRVWLAGRQFEIPAGTIYTKTLDASDPMITILRNPTNFDSSYYELRDQTTYPSACCTTYPWSGGMGKPCRVMAWYNVCCEDTRVQCEGWESTF